MYFYMLDLPRKKESLSADEMKQNKELLTQWNKKGIFPLISLVSTEEKEVSHTFWLWY